MSHDGVVLMNVDTKQELVGRSRIKYREQVAFIYGFDMGFNYIIPEGFLGTGTIRIVIQQSGVLPKYKLFFLKLAPPPPLSVFFCCLLPICWPYQWRVPLLGIWCHEVGVAELSGVLFRRWKVTVRGWGVYYKILGNSSRSSYSVKIEKQNSQSSIFTWSNSQFAWKWGSVRNDLKK